MKTQLKIIIRGLLKNKKYLFFSVSGLIISFAFFLLLFAYLRSELTYDRFAGYENIYRVTTKVTSNGSTVKETAMSQMPLGEALKEKIPGVVAFTRILAEENLYRTEEVKLNRQKTYWVDQAFLDIFPLEMVEGSAKDALGKPVSGLISEDAARKFFGNSPAVGKTLTLNEGGYFVVQINGVFRKPKGKSHFDFDYLFSFKTTEICNPFQNNWDTDAFYTYIKLAPGTNPLDIKNKLAQFAAATYVDYPKKNQRVELGLQPVASIHLQSHLSNELSINSRYNFMVIIAILGLFTLLVSWLNFSGMVSSRYLSNQTSLLMNRILGSPHSLLVTITVEIFILCLAALALAVPLTLVFGNEIFSMMGVPVSVYPLPIALALASFLLLAATVFCSVVAGAMLIGKLPKAGRSPASSGKVVGTRQSSLVVLQYSFSIFLIIFLAIAFKQIHFLKKSNPGYSKEQVLVVHSPRTLIMKPERITNGNLFINELKRNGYAVSGTVTSDLPGKPVHTELGGFFWLSPVQSPDLKLAASSVCVDHGYFETLGLKLVAGRNFEEKEGQNAGKIIVNEKAAREMGFDDPQKAVGETISANNENNDNKAYTILGVVSDFHQEGLQEEIKPMAFTHSYFYLFGSCGVKLANAQPSTIASVKRAWESVFPNDPFDYYFLDERFNQQYHSEMLFFRVCLIFGIIATLIACYGLFGISVEIISKRTKEIGVRKVNGATVLEILRLLNTTYMKWTAIAFLVASPVAWYFVDKWLESFAYRTSLSWWIFALAGLLALGIALLTVSWKSWKAATRNPVEALRYE